jgi:hypothetical protein
MSSTGTRGKKASNTPSLKVNVNGKEIEVIVLNDGIFTDKTRLYSATTLKGLQRSMEKKDSIEGNVPIETVTGKLGTVIAFNPNTNTYKVKWDNGKTTYEYSNRLRIRTDGAAAIQLSELQKAIDTAESNLDQANDDLDDYEESLKAGKILTAVFHK